MGRLKDPLEDYPYQKPRFLNRGGSGTLAEVHFLRGVIAVQPEAAGLTERQRRCLIRANLGQSDSVIADRLTRFGMFATVRDVRNDLDIVENTLGVDSRYAYFPAAAAAGVFRVAEYGDPVLFPANLPELQVLQQAAMGVDRKEIGDHLTPPISAAGVTTRLARLREKTQFAGLEISVTCAAIVNLLDPMSLEIVRAAA